MAFGENSGEREAKHGFLRVLMNPITDSPSQFLLLQIRDLLCATETCLATIVIEKPGRAGRDTMPCRM